MALNKVQTTYQTQLLQYQGEAQATTCLIKKLKEERQAAEDKSKMGLNQIRDIALTWRDRMKRLIKESLVQWWSKWAQQATESRVLRADVENRQKDGGNFYKMDAESIMTIWEEFSDDFLSVAGEQLTVVRRLVEHLDDGKLGTQLQFEQYEWERRRQVASQISAVYQHQ